MGVDDLIVVLMAFNTVISASWAVGAFRVARSERLFQWPVPWRWLVFGWMGWKAALFVALEAALAVSIPEYAAVVVVVGFTVAHTWAFARWLRLPDVRDGQAHLIACHDRVTELETANLLARGLIDRLRAQVDAQAMELARRGAGYD